MDIRSVMTADPACCNAGATLQEAARMMRENDCGQIPVVDEANKPLGVITDRDIAVRAVADGADAATATVSDYMTSPVTTIREAASLEDCAQLMGNNQIRRVVVVDQQGCLAGIVAQADIARTGRDAKTAEVVKEVSEPSRSH
jgi:CBS domain-containing protein